MLGKASLLGKGALGAVSLVGKVGRGDGGLASLVVTQIVGGRGRDLDDGGRDRTVDRCSLARGKTCFGS